MRTRAGFSVRFVRKSSANGTVIDEKPYPSAPLTTAAPNAIRVRADRWFGINGNTASPSGDKSRELGRTWPSDFAKEKLEDLERRRGASHLLVAGPIQMH